MNVVYRMRDESVELQPLHPGPLETGNVSSPGPSGKGVLRRMSRVRSDENYSQEESLEDQSPAAPTAKLGEGLPLLHRLRLLKEKQDREERGKHLLTPSSPPPASGPLSPPALRLQPPQEEPQEREVLGAGLPLIQRLRLLKQKEDHKRLTIQATAAVTADVLANTVRMQQEDEIKSVQLTVSPPGRKVKDNISDDSRHSSSSKEQSEDESSLASRKPSLLNRLVSITHKDSSSTSVVKQSSGSSGGVSPHLTSDASSSSSADPCMPVTAKVPLLRDKLKLLTQESVLPSSSSSTTGTAVSLPKVRAHSSAKSESDSSSCTTEVLKKQHSWSLLKKASILSSQNSNELSKESAVTVPKSTSTYDHPALSNEVHSSGISKSEPKEQLNSNFTSVGTVSTDEMKVITVCDNGHSESLPSEPSSTVRVSEVINGKSVSLFKQRLTELAVEDQGQQSTISQASKVQDKLKNEELHVLAQWERKEREDNKLTEVTANTPGEEVKDPLSEHSEETASSASVTEEAVAQPSVKLMDSAELTSVETSKVSSPKRQPKPNLLRLQKDTKFYMSIDDLSPEYSGLPFVKKLKILNERQKLAELEQKVAHVLMRSSSLDSSNAVSGAAGGSGDSMEYPIDPMNLTRSHSEACAMQYVRNQQICKDSFSWTGSQTNKKDDEDDRIATSQQRPTELPPLPASEAPQSLTSPESNETVERRNLKSILKKLSATSLFSGSSEDTKVTLLSGEQRQPSPAVGITTVQPTVKPSTVDMHKLMRAQTVEGYAARHSKLTKSVTFNRDTLQSPPAIATTPTKLPQEHTGSLFPFPIASEDHTVSAFQTTSITTCTSSVSTTVTPSAVISTSSPEFHTTTAPHHETLPTLTAPVTMAVSTTLRSVVSSATISSTISSVSPLPIITSEPSQVPQATNMPKVPTDTKESAYKKKPPVSFLVQHPQQIPLPAKDKNSFRPSLFLPSHMTLEEEYFNEVIAGFKQVIQGHLVSSATIEKWSFHMYSNKIHILRIMDITFQMIN